MAFTGNCVFWLQRPSIVKVVEWIDYETLALLFGMVTKAYLLLWMCWVNHIQYRDVSLLNILLIVLYWDMVWWKSGPWGIYQKGDDQISEGAFWKCWSFSIFFKICKIVFNILKTSLRSINGETCLNAKYYHSHLSG